MTVPKIVGITPGDHGAVDRWATCRALSRAGLRTILVREPQLDAAALDALVLNLWASFPSVVVHDKHPLARRYGAPIHLGASGQADGYGAPWSQSCHTPHEVDRALALGASWVTLSPVWRPTSKPDDTREPLGLDRFLEVARGRPVLALGGVTPERAALLASHGVGIAVSGILFGHDSPQAAAAACASLIRSWREAYVPGSQEPVADEVPGSSSDSGTPTGNSRSS